MVSCINVVDVAVLIWHNNQELTWLYYEVWECCMNADASWKQIKILQYVYVRFESVRWLYKFSTNPPSQNTMWKKYWIEVLKAVFLWLHQPGALNAGGCWDAIFVCWRVQWQVHHQTHRLNSIHRKLRSMTCMHSVLLCSISFWMVFVHFFYNVRVQPVSVYICQFQIALTGYFFDYCVGW